MKENKWITGQIIHIDGGRSSSANKSLTKLNENINISHYDVVLAYNTYSFPIPKDGNKAIIWCHKKK